MSPLFNDSNRSPLLPQINLLMALSTLFSFKVCGHTRIVCWQVDNDEELGCCSLTTQVVLALYLDTKDACQIPSMHFW